MLGYPTSFEWTLRVVPIETHSSPTVHVCFIARIQHSYASTKRWASKMEARFSACSDASVLLEPELST